MKKPSESYLGKLCCHPRNKGGDPTVIYRVTQVFYTNGNATYVKIGKRLDGKPTSRSMRERRIPPRDLEFVGPVEIAKLKVEMANAYDNT